MLSFGEWGLEWFLKSDGKGLNLGLRVYLNGCCVKNEGF